jgi:hypothetical protein
MPVKARTIPLDGDGVIDLDARRAARLERSGPKQVRFGGKTWLFKSELPMQVVSDFTAGDIQGAFARILADPGDAEGFLRNDLSQDDFRELMELVYQLDMGKASPSTGS